MVTAPRQYSTKLSSKLVNAGARPLVVPAVQIVDLQGDDLEQFRTQLRRWVLQQPQEAAAASSSAPAATTAAGPMGSPQPGASAAGRQPPPATPGGRDHQGQQQGQQQPAHEGPITHIAFTSKNGIHATLEQLAHVAGGLPQARDALLASGVRLCALGADGGALEAVGLPVHVSPAEASTQGLVRELVRRGEAAGARVLCPVPLVAGGLVEPPVVPRFLKALEDAGARPLRLPAYLTTLGCQPDSCEAERHALHSGAVHAVAFSSTAEAQGLLQLMGGPEALADSVRRHGVVLAAHGPYTAEGAGNVLGLPVTVVSRNFSTFDGLVAALEGHFASVGGGR